MVGVSDAVDRQDEAPHGTAMLPSDLTDDQLAAAPVLASVDALLIEELSDDEDAAFALPSSREDRCRHGSRPRLTEPVTAPEVRDADRLDGWEPGLPGCGHAERASLRRARRWMG